MEPTNQNNPEKEWIKKCNKAEIQLKWEEENRN